MRAVLVKSKTIVVGADFLITDAPFHHLKNVIRIKLGEQLLILTGQGERFLAQVKSIEKRVIVVSILEKEEVADLRKIDVVFALTKKASLELALKMAVELNVRRFFIVTSAYSQRYSLGEKRIAALLQSALEQSNAPYFPLVEEGQEIISLLENTAHNYQQIFLFDLVPNPMQAQQSASGETLLIIGPEGGFSDMERERMLQYKNIKVCYLPTNILRASTALPAAVGYILRGEES